MKLQFMTSKALATLKNNLPTIYSKYFTETNNQWISQICDSKAFEDTDIEIDDFKLASLHTGLTAGEIDLENCKIVYRNLMQLNETQAGDERLWAGLTNGMFYNYMRARWGYDIHGPQDEKKDISDIKTRFFFQGNRRAGFYRNTLAKCWWIGRALYEPSKSNPFRKLDILGASDLNSKITAIFYSNTFSSNPVIVDGIILAIEHYNKKGFKLSEKRHIRVAMGILNAIGGNIILDCLSAEEIKNILVNIIDGIIKGKYNQQIKFLFEKEEEVETNVEDTQVVAPSKQKVMEGNTVFIRSLDGQDTKSFSIKKYRGEIPPFSKLLIGKSIDDEVNFRGKAYTIIKIK